MINSVIVSGQFPGHVVSYFHLDLNEKRRQKKRGGGSQIPDCMYARGGGVIQMRIVCNRGGGGGLKIGKKCVCN